LRTPAGVLGAGLTLVISVVALLAPALAPHNPVLLDVPPLERPSLLYPFGTDHLGRDILSGVLLGARPAMTVVLAVAASTAVLGILLGSLAAYCGRWIDDLITRLAEVVQAVPRFFLAILVAAYFGGDLRNLIILLSLTSWPFLARVVRAECLSVVQREYVSAARLVGASGARILVRHVVPNILPSALVVLAITGSRVILLESSLSFLGLGDPELISWGFLLNNAQGFLQTAWWMAVFPGLAIVAAVLGLNLLADALTDLLNPLLPERHNARNRRSHRPGGSRSRDRRSPPGGSRRPFSGRR
jgi:peptide/nickel transport system permease protein